MSGNPERSIPGPPGDARGLRATRTAAAALRSANGSEIGERRWWWSPRGAAAGEPAGEADATPFMAEDPSGRDL